jgi:hypothetical protein
MNDEGAVPKWLREQSAKLRFSGSNPLGASIVKHPIIETGNNQNRGWPQRQHCIETGNLEALKREF